MASPPPDPQMQAQTVALAVAYQQRTQALRDRVEFFVANLWRSLGSYRDRQMVSFAKQVLPVVTGAEQHMADLTASYLAVHRQIVIGGTSTPVAVDKGRVTGPATRSGVAPLEVYERPFHKVWRDLGDGKPFDKAVEQGLIQAQKTAVTDLQRTKVLTSQAVVARDRRATWYERILEGPHSCGLCIVASTQRYRKAKLLPIHPGCDCGVAPHYGDPDDEPLNLPRLRDVHAAIENTFGHSSAGARAIPGLYTNGEPVRYRDVLIEHEHGELGTVLGVRGHAFTGPNDLA